MWYLWPCDNFVCTGVKYHEKECMDCFMTAREQMDKARGSQYPLQGHASNDLISFSYSPPLKNSQQLPLELLLSSKSWITMSLWENIEIQNSGPTESSKCSHLFQNAKSSVHPKVDWDSGHSCSAILGVAKVALNLKQWHMCNKTENIRNLSTWQYH